MRIIGIIAEYNPFHNGHAYQIEKIRSLTQADFVIAAMSGNFVQRGEPALIDKYARTEMALNCGADLVIELPALFATASAELFASAGVALMRKCGCVDTLCFGAETDNLSLLKEVASLLVSEPADYKEVLSSCLKKGMSYPAARSQAVCSYLKEANPQIPADELACLLNEPNNILAIEYLKAIQAQNAAITPYLIQRTGDSYHEAALNSSLSSATAIRKELLSNGWNDITTLNPYLPEAAYSILKEYLNLYPPVSANDFSTPLSYLLLQQSEAQLAFCGDSNEAIAHRIKNLQKQFHSFEQFCQLLKTKDMTYTRISRIFTHLLLQITSEDYRLGKFLDYIPYLRILGFRKDASRLLTILSNYADVPMISKSANAASMLSPDAARLFNLDVFAGELYENILSGKTGQDARSEFVRNIVRV